MYLLIRFFVRLNGLYWLYFVLDVGPLLGKCSSSCQRPVHDGCPLTMTVTLVILAIWHPGRCLPGVLTAVRLGSTQSSGETA
jgi:hypothetical protein